MTAPPGPGERPRRTVRERARGYVLVVAAAIGLTAEMISTAQDGVTFTKVVALACFTFLFWYGWDLARPARS
jgi:hypothetical protein